MGNEQFIVLTKIKMTFDDGILKVYKVENAAKNGDKPKFVLTLKSSFYFGYESLGYNRYYTALQAKNKIDSVVRIWQDKSINSTDICIVDEKQFKITLIQHVKDDDGIDITRLTLERMDETYEFNHENQEST